MPVNTIYLIHHTHTDLGFTHDQEVVLDLHRQFLDEVLDLCERTADYPAGSSLRWTCESTLTLLDWMRRRDSRQIERFLALERAGFIEVTGCLASLSQCMSQEALWRYLYPVRTLRQDYGMTIRCGMQTDVNGLHWGNVDAFAQCGLENLLMATNETVGRAAFTASRPNGFRWQSPSGSEVLVWNGLHYNNNQYFGLSDDFDRAVRELPRFLAWLEKRSYPYDFCLFQPTCNTFNDNGPADLRLAGFVRRWNAEGRSPRLEIVTPATFFQVLRREPAAQVPVRQGEWSDFWNFGATSTAYETQLNRGTERRLVEAEWLSACAGANGVAGRQRDLAEGWEQALLYDEHTWGANVSTAQPWAPATRSQLNQKLGCAYRARSKAQLVRLEAADRLARAMAAPPGRYVMAINPLPWERTQRLTFPAAWLEGYSSMVPELVVDQSAPRRHVVHEVHDTVSRVQYLDRNDFGEQQSLASSDTLVSVPLTVPALGCRLFGAAELHGRAAGPVEETAAATAENPFLAVALDPVRGGLASLYDKSRACEWADPEAGTPLGAYLHEEIAGASPDRPYGGRTIIYGEADWSRFMGYGSWNKDYPAPRRGVSRVLSQTIQRLPGAVRLRQVCAAPGVRSVEYAVTLPEDRPWVDLQVTLDKLWNPEPEACYLVFPFALPGARARYDTAGAVVAWGDDQLPGSNRDCPTVQSWADWSTAARGIQLVTPDAPVMMFGGCHLGHLLDGPAPDQPAVLVSMVMSNYWHVNYAAAQHGPVTFHYRLCPHDAFDPVAANRRAREAASPLWGHPVKDPGGDRPATICGLTIDHGAVDVLACKESEDGGDLVLRLRNTSFAPVSAVLSLPAWPIEQAWVADGLEVPQAAAPVERGRLAISLPPQGVATYLIRRGVGR
jgi:alpha-mannosidase